MQKIMMTRRVAIGSMAAFALAGTAHATVPAVQPLPGVPTLPLGAFDPTATGHVVEEYILSGTASSYKESGTVVEPAGTAPYVTRIVVIRPADVKKYNGTVVVEWLNVTGGIDYGPVWNMARRAILRSGSTYVAVSAQAIGIEGGITHFGINTPGLKKSNPQRYGRLSHPGDAYSYDIFSQAGALLKSPGAGGVLGKLVPRQVIGMGESQSAFYLTTYVNAIDPLAHVYDGYLIYSRFGGAAAVDGSWMMKPTPGASYFVKMRDDLRVPTMIFLTETDVIGPGAPGYYGARVPDNAHLRVWEVAGTSHADVYLFKVSEIDSGTASYAALAAAWAPTNEIYGAKLDKSVNNAPQHHYIVESAIVHLERWVASGQAPPHGQPIKLAGTGQKGDPVHTVVDENGNAYGGVRSPWVDVPVSVLSGAGNSGSPLAMLSGSAVPFDASELAKLYPGGKAEYLKRFGASLGTAIQAGFILPDDKDEILGIAALAYPA